mgnify:CR=1 FL=1
MFALTPVNRYPPAPGHTYREIAQATKKQAADEAAQQEWFPDRGEAIAQPVKAQLELYVLQRRVNDQRADLVGESLRGDGDVALDLGHHFLHEAMTYASWQTPDIQSSMKSAATTVDDLRAEGIYQVVTPAEAVELPAVIHHPLCGGMPIDAGWQSLQLCVDALAQST